MISTFWEEVGESRMGLIIEKRRIDVDNKTYPLFHKLMLTLSPLPNCEQEFSAEFSQKKIKKIKKDLLGERLWTRKTPH